MERITHETLEALLVLYSAPPAKKRAHAIYAADVVEDLRDCRTERDQLKAEVERLRGEVTAIKEDGFFGRMAGKLATEKQAAEAHVADLRAALEKIQGEIKAFEHDGQEYEDERNACTSEDCPRCAVWHCAENALARVPEQSMGRLKAAALREAAARAEYNESAGYHLISREQLLLWADRLEANHGQ